MTVEQVESKVKEIIVEQLGVDEAQVEGKASFVEDLGADSLDIVELVMAFEEDSYGAKRGGLHRCQEEVSGPPPRFLRSSTAGCFYPSRFTLESGMHRRDSVSVQWQR